MGRQKRLPDTGGKERAAVEEVAEVYLSRDTEAAAARDAKREQRIKLIEAMVAGGLKTFTHQGRVFEVNAEPEPTLRVTKAKADD